VEARRHLLGREQPRVLDRQRHAVGQLLQELQIHLVERLLDLVARGLQQADHALAQAQRREHVAARRIGIDVAAELGPHLLGHLLRVCLRHQDRLPLRDRGADHAAARTRARFRPQRPAVALAFLGPRRPRGQLERARGLADHGDAARVRPAPDDLLHRPGRHAVELDPRVRQALRALPQELQSLGVTLDLRDLAPPGHHVIAHGVDRVIEPAIPGPVVVLEGSGLAIAGDLLEELVERRTTCGRKQLPEELAAHGLGLEAEELLGGRVEVHDAAVPLVDRDAVDELSKQRVDRREMGRSAHARPQVRNTGAKPPPGVRKLVVCP
jgi:hypothetical protein